MGAARLIMAPPTRRDLRALQIYKRLKLISWAKLLIELTNDPATKDGCRVSVIRS
jgi:hypothetical protein